MSALLCVDISIETAPWATAFPNAEQLAKQAAEATWDNAGKPETDAEISIVLADDPMIRTLNDRYRGQDRATNVLSFPAEGSDTPNEPILLGDVILAYDTIVREAGEQSKPVEKHFLHLCVHGTLHLLGYDHESEAEAVEMETREVAILETLGVGNPYEAEDIAKKKRA